MEHRKPAKFHFPKIQTKTPNPPNTKAVKKDKTENREKKKSNVNVVTNATADPAIDTTDTNDARKNPFHQGNLQIGGAPYVPSCGSPSRT